MENSKDHRSYYRWIKNPRYAVKSVFSFICALAIISFLLLFITNHLTSLLLSLKIVPPNLILLSQPPLYAYIPYRVTILPLRGPGLYAYFLFLVVSIIASIAWIVKNESKDALKIFKDALRFKQPLRFDSKNSFILLPQLFLLYFFCITVYWSSLDITGIYPAWGGGEYPSSWELMFKYANASVYEEVFFRFFLIGIPLFIVDFARRKDNPLRRYVFGDGFEFNFFTISLLMISSIIFGIAHINFPNTTYEFPPMLFIGLVFGYLFLKKGIYASIILHFSIDYMDMLAISGVGKTYMDLADAANSSLVFLNTATTFLTIPLFATLLLIVLGSVAAPFYFGFYAKKFILFTVEKIGRIIESAKNL